MFNLESLAWRHRRINTFTRDSSPNKGSWNSEPSTVSPLYGNFTNLHSCNCQKPILHQISKHVAFWNWFYFKGGFFGFQKHKILPEAACISRPFQPALYTISMLNSKGCSFWTKKMKKFKTSPKIIREMENNWHGKWHIFKDRNMIEMGNYWLVKG